MRTAAKRDANEPAIIEGLEADGNLVQPLEQGDGCPDILVLSRHTLEWVVMEIKNPAQWPSDRRLRPAQVTWFTKFNGNMSAGVGPHTVRAYKIETLAEALACVRLVRTNTGALAPRGEI